jgi:hypothetical protein
MMNPRIKEFRFLAADYANEQKPLGTTKWQEIRDEKFAELIVRECAQIAVFKDSGTVATADVAGHMAAGRSIAARLIREHFGVEE